MTADPVPFQPMSTNLQSSPESLISWWSSLFADFHSFFPTFGSPPIQTNVSGFFLDAAPTTDHFFLPQPPLPPPPINLDNTLIKPPPPP